MPTSKDILCVVVIYFLSLCMESGVAWASPPPPHRRHTTTTTTIGLQQTTTTENNNEQEQKQKQNSNEFDICIIGGSIAGLALSIGLQSQFPDLSVALVEKRSFSRKAGSVLGLAPNGQKAIQDLLASNSSNSNNEQLVKTIIKDGEEIKGPKELNFRTMTVLVFWYKLRDALLDFTQKMGGRLSIFTEMELHDVKEEEEDPSSENNNNDSTMKLIFHKNNNNNNNNEQRPTTTTTLSAKLLVGADGVHSTVRHLIGLPSAVISDTTSIRGTLILNEDSPKSLRELKENIILNNNDTTLYVVTIKNTPNVISWALSTKTKNIIKEESKDNNNNDDIIDKVLCLLGYNNNNDDRENSSSSELEIASMILCATEKDNILYTQNAVMDMSSGWGVRKNINSCCTLVGDSAHACRPTDGQGGNMALEDCVVFCRILHKYYNNSQNKQKIENMKQMIMDFEQSRYPRVQRIHEDQHLRADLGANWVPWTSEFTDWVHGGV